MPAPHGAIETALGRLSFIKGLGAYQREVRLAEVTAARAELAALCDALKAADEMLENVKYVIDDGVLDRRLLNSSDTYRTARAKVGA